MTTQLNGINYTEMLLTDEELAVVKAMRSEGSRIVVFVDFKTENEALDYVVNFPKRVDYWTSHHVKSKFVTTTTEFQKVNVYANYEKKTKGLQSN